MLKPKISFVSFNYKELQNLNWVEAGQKINCPHCKQQHKLVPGVTNGKLSDAILFFQCGATDYLGAIENRLIINS